MSRRSWRPIRGFSMAAEIDEADTSDAETYINMIAAS